MTIRCLRSLYSRARVRAARPAEGRQARGKGRQGGPLGPDGNALECYDCGSTHHLKRDCDGSGPRGSRSGASAAPHFHSYVASAAEERPLDGMAQPGQTVHTVFMMHQVEERASSSSAPPVFVQNSQEPAHIIQMPAPAPEHVQSVHRFYAGVEN